MSYPQSQSPYPSSTNPPYQIPNRQFTPTPFDPSTPPPPPPKPLTHEPNRLSTPQTGAPPLPPPPPPAAHVAGEQYPPQNPQEEGQQPNTSGPSPPLTTEEGWIPSILKNTSKSDLQTLLSTPSLLSALLAAPSTTHPSLPPSLSPIHASLTQNIHLSTHLLALSDTLDALRARTQSSLLQLHALERQWRAKQAAVDDALQPFSHRALYERLVQGIGEQEALTGALEETFLEGEDEGRVGERELGDFVKRFREGRRVVWVRRERRERWDEGRVGGWR